MKNGRSRFQIITGDCRKRMASMRENSVDTVITDPPYGLAFMGKDWDKAVPGPDYWAAALRVARPGATLLAFGGTRTFHRMACAIEDAGWILRDTLLWLYGQGFPKSLDLSKAIDKAAGSERKVTGKKGGRYASGFSDVARDHFRGMGGTGFTGPADAIGNITAPATAAAALWQGWGSALKPGWEPIIMAMKPLDGTFAGNALAHGVAGLNIDGCRIGAGGDGYADREQWPCAEGGKIGNNVYGGGMKRRYAFSPLGRFPANVILDEAAAAMLDEQSGASKSTGGGGVKKRGIGSGNGIYGEYGGRDLPADVGIGDSGGASRFFYCAKAGTAEREAGLDGMPEGALSRSCQAQAEAARGNVVDAEGGGYNKARRRRNLHPTVKPLALMRWLCRLTATPIGGLVLDPFAGSGSTGVAAVLEDRPFLGIEIDPAFAGIAVRRIKHALGRAGRESG